MHQIRFRLGLRPRPGWEELTALHQTPIAGFEGSFAAGGGLGWGRGGKGERKGREGEVEGREREGPKLLLNQGPSEPCYTPLDAVDRKRRRSCDQ